MGNDTVPSILAHICTLDLDLLVLIQVTRRAPDLPYVRVNPMTGAPLDYHLLSRHPYPPPHPLYPQDERSKQFLVKDTAPPPATLHTYVSVLCILRTSGSSSFLGRIQPPPSNVAYICIRAPDLLQCPLRRAPLEYHVLSLQCPSLPRRYHQDGVRVNPSS